MGFAAAVQSGFAHYATFSGRARRSEFWWFSLFVGLLYLVAFIVDAAIGSSVISILVILGLLIPTLAVTARRLHDTGRTGWWMLISFVPLVGTIVMLVFECQDSHYGPNMFGTSPKYPTPAGAH